MTLTKREAPHPPTQVPAQVEDPFIVLHGVSWDRYVALGDLLGEGHPNLKMVYLEGTLEIMTRGPRHEWAKTTLARLIELYAALARVRLNGYGEMTRRRKETLRGLEPDECYFVGRDLEGEAMDIPPDLALEVTITSGYVDKLEVYRGLEVPEVWFWKEGRIEVYRLARGKYARRKRSQFLPDLDLVELARFASMPEQAVAVEAFMDWIGR